MASNRQASPIREFVVRGVAFAALGAFLTIAVSALPLVLPLEATIHTQRSTTSVGYRNWSVVDRVGFGWKVRESTWITEDGWSPLSGLRGGAAASAQAGEQAWQRGETADFDRIHAWAAFARPADGDPPRSLTQAIVVEMGWPWSAVRGGVSVHIADGQRPREDAIERHGAILVGTAEFLGRGHWGSAMVIPLRPHPLGFALNTLLFAAACATVVWLRGTIIRASRRRRDCCTRCGHTLSGASGCTECGAMATPRG